MTDQVLTNRGNSMREELVRAFKAPQAFASFIVCFVTLSGYSLGYWIGSIIAGEWIEYRESALHLSIGGIFFGGFAMLLPFCAALAHSTSQVDDMRSGMMHWEALRGSVSKFVRTKVGACMITAAATSSGAFVLHAIIWNIVAVPIDPLNYPNHTIYFSKQCIYNDWYTVCHGLPVYIEMTLGIAFVASIWAVVALAISVWAPDKLLTVAIPSFLYFLWNADVSFFFTGTGMPHPSILFNDGLTVQKAIISILSYLVVWTISIIAYAVGCRRRCCHV